MKLAISNGMRNKITIKYLESQKRELERVFKSVYGVKLIDADTLGSDEQLGGDIFNDAIRFNAKIYVLEELIEYLRE